MTLSSRNHLKSQHSSYTDLNVSPTPIKTNTNTESTLLAIQYEVYGLKGTICAKCMTDLSLTGDQHPPMEASKYTIADSKQAFSGAMQSFNQINQPFDLFVTNEKWDSGPNLHQLKSAYRTSKIYHLDPLNHTSSQWYSLKQISNQHAPQGTSRISNLVQNTLKIHHTDGIILAQKLAIQLSLGVGPQSGINLLAAIILQMHLGIHLAITTIFPDNYLHFKPDCQHVPSHQSIYHYSHDIAFLGYTVFRKE